MSSEENIKENTKGGSNENTKGGSKENTKGGSKENTKGGSKENTKEGSKENTKEGSKENTKEGSNQKPEKNYTIIIMIVLFLFILIFLGLLTFLVGKVEKSNACQSVMDIQCYDDWKCETQCPVGKGYVSCLTGGSYDDGTLTKCLYAYFENPCIGLNTGNPACACNNTQQNCLFNCPLNTSNINPVYCNLTTS